MVADTRSPQDDALSGAGARHVRLSPDGPEFNCPGEDTVLRAALRDGVGLPYECSSGGCGACRVLLLEGEVEDLWPTAPGLPQRQRERGYRLACQIRPLSPCVIRVRTPLRTIALPRPRRRRAQLVDRLDLTPDMAEFTFQADGEADFVPGQFALLSLPGITGDRAYSMSNLPNAEGLWRFVIKRMPKGLGSERVFNLLTNTHTVGLDGPYGGAYLRAESTRNVVCIAGGSGLSPMLSILSAAARATGTSRQLRLFYGGRRLHDLCAPAMIERDPWLKRQVSCITAISDMDESDTWRGERGFIHDVARRVIESELDPSSNDYYFCGPPVMTEAVQAMLLDLRVPHSQLYYDRFV